MKISKKQIVYGSTALFAVALLAGGGVYSVSAANTPGAQMSSIVQKIAQKFGVPQAEVQAVFDAERQEHMQHMQAQAEQRLSDLVTAGKITQAQKELVLSKQKELEANRQASFEALKDKTQAERRAAMEAQRTELEAWAKANGIDAQYLMFGHGKGGHRGGMGMHRPGMMGAPAQVAPSVSAPAQ